MSTVSTVVYMLMLTAGTAVPVSAMLAYDAREPHEVRAVFRAGLGDTAEWVLARSLLAAGLTGRAGGGALVSIGLTSPEGTVRLEAPAGPVAAFLDLTCRLVPAGTEPPRTDIAAVIGGEPP